MKIFLPEQDENVHENMLHEQIDDLHMRVEKYMQERNDSNFRNEQLLERLRNKNRENIQLKQSQTSLKNSLQMSVNEKNSIWKRYYVILFVLLSL